MYTDEEAEAQTDSADRWKATNLYAGGLAQAPKSLTAISLVTLIEKVGCCCICKEVI